MSPERTQRTSNLRVLFTPLPYFWLKGFGVNLFFMVCNKVPPSPSLKGKNSFLLSFGFIPAEKESLTLAHTHTHMH